MIKKAVIPAAGMGTRLLSVTKEQPKEMLPIFARGIHGELCLKPIVQLVFEQLYQSGFREFCFVVGRAKRAIEDHFTPDFGFVSMLDSKGKDEPARDLESFYRMIEGSTLVWVNQPEPKGFGDAVLKVKSFVGTESFLVHAGDTYFVSKNTDYLKKLLKADSDYGADVTLLAQEVSDPTHFGIVEGEDIGNDILQISRVMEKPERPLSKVAISAVYVFKPSIFEALEVTEAGHNGEVQLTDGIQKLIEWKRKACGVVLNSEFIRLDIGSPNSYWEAQVASYKFSR